MKTMTREEMLAELTTFCQLRPLDGCSTCPIRRRLAQGFGCIKIKDRTDEMLAADIEKIAPKEPPVEKSIVMPAPEQPSIRYMVTVDRDLLQTITGKLVMLSCCAGATINTEMSNELLAMADQIQAEIDACDHDALEAEKAMHEALRREGAAMFFEKGETLIDEEEK